MSSATIRISDETKDILRELAVKDGTPMQTVLERAVETYRRQRFLEGLSADFAKLQTNPKAWQDELEDRKLWDSTLADGLER